MFTFNKANFRNFEISATFLFFVFTANGENRFEFGYKPDLPWRLDQILSTSCVLKSNFLAVEDPLKFNFNDQMFKL